MMGWTSLALSLPVLHSDWHPISVHPLLSARLTSLSDLSAHRLHRLPDARAVRNIQQEGLQSGGGSRCQVCGTFLCEAGGHDLETFSVQLFGQKIPKAAVTACDEHMFLAETINLVGISDVPADGSERGQKENTG